MKIKRPPPAAFAESAAASDMAFLLIIYFLVIAGFNVNLGFLLTLPQRDSVVQVLQEDLLRFELDSLGNIIHSGEVVAVPYAASLIQSAQNANPNLAVVLTIDPLAQWQSVVSFVELAQDLDIGAFSFSMSQGGQP